jgi:octopine/nopaline transport system substrate-binding protein
MKKLISVAVAAALVTMAGVADAKDWKNIRIASEGAYPPWNSTDASGKLIGFDIDVANEVCKRQKVECEIIATAWDGIIPGLTSGKYDAIIAGMSITKKRMKVIAFSENYAQTPGSLAVVKDSPLASYKASLAKINLDAIGDAEKAEFAALKKALKGKTIGVQVATTHFNFLEKYLGDAVTIRTYDTQENLDLDLHAGRVDAADASLAYWKPLMEKDAGKNLALIGPGFAGDVIGAGNGVGIRKEDKELVALFSKGIRSMKKDGTLVKLAMKWFGFDNIPK